eukprot:7452522-Pyramimonas_sp.AAC.1
MAEKTNATPTETENADIQPAKYLEWGTDSWDALWNSISDNTLTKSARASPPNWIKDSYSF